MSLAKNSVKVVVLLGPPGSGKGTQAKHLVQTHPNWVHISTGDLFRAEIASASKLGNSVKDMIASGVLVPDDVTGEVFKSQVKLILENKKPGALILDGYPRNPAQAQSLLDFCQTLDALRKPAAVELFVSSVEVLSRLGGRLINPRTGKIYHKVSNPPKISGICDDDGGPLVQRPDDQEKTILARYALYEDQRDAMIEVLKKESRDIMRVDGIGSLSDVSERLGRAIEAATAI